MEAISVRAGVILANGRMRWVMTRLGVADVRSSPRNVRVVRAVDAIEVGGGGDDL